MAERAASYREPNATPILYVTYLPMHAHDIAAERTGARTIGQRPSMSEVIVLLDQAGGRNGGKGCVIA